MTNFASVFATLPGGWLSDVEGELLWNTALACSGDILEIGSYCGRSSLLLANAAAQIGRRLTCCDPFIAEFHDVRRESSREIAADFCESVCRSPVAHAVSLCWNTEEDLYGQWRPTSLGLLYVDIGVHTYEETIGALRRWAPLARTIAMHDYESGAFPGVARAAQAFGLGTPMARAGELAIFSTPPQLRTSCPATMPRIHVHAPCFNEELMLPYFLRHYSFAERIFLYDNCSTDRTAAIADSDPRVTRTAIDTGGKYLESSLMEIKNHAWKSSRDSAEWVIVCDVDELLYHPDWPRLFADLADSRASIAKPAGYEMVASEFTPDDGQTPLTQVVRLGDRDDFMAKPVLFDPRAISEIHYQPGCHVALPDGRVNWFCSPHLKMLHYRKMGWGFYETRSRRNAARIIPDEVERGWHAHLLDERRERLWFDQILTRAVEVI